jgi:nitrogen fixation protein NifU and related proteins
MDNSSMYKDHILELWKNPENKKELSKPTHKKRGFNESCGDDVTIYLSVKANKIVDASFTGTGCALCIASSSMVTEKLKGMNVSDLKKMTSKDVLDLLEIQIHPARLRCILLPLETAQKSIDEKR